MSNLKNDNVPCHYIILANVTVAKGCVALSNLRNGPDNFMGIGPLGRVRAVTWLVSIVFVFINLLY